jgi:flagellar biosynthetic protein FliR
MDILNISPQQLQIFILVLIRVSVVLFLFPIFESAVIPAVIKAGLSLVVALLLVPAVAVAPARFPPTVLETGMLLVSELFIGMLLGLTVRLFLAGVQFAGQIIGFQMGFSIINVFDPQSGGQVSIIDQVSYWMVLLIFLILNGHHVLILALSESFRILAPGALVLKRGLLTMLIGLSSQMFVLGIKMAAPAIAALLFTDAAFGLSAKFAPQMNILIAAFPLKIVVGLIFFGLALDIAAMLTRDWVAQLPLMLKTVMAWLGG